MEALVRVKIEMRNECGENEGKDPVGEENVPLVEVVHVSGGRRVFEEDGKARSEHRTESSNDGAEVDVVGQVLNVSHIGSSREKGVQ